MRVSGSTCCLLLGLALAPAPAAADTLAPVALGGIVHDTLGNAVEGAEVLVVAPVRAVEPLAMVRSGADGRFRVARLVPGAYRLAAVKDGYLTFVGSVDTAAVRFVEVVLHPMPELDEELPAPLPRDSSWALRLPRRYVLHEGAAGIDAEREDVADGAWLDRLEWQVDQLVAVGSGFAGGRASEASDIHGSETRLGVASAFGDRAALRFEGRRESFDSTRRTEAEDLASASRDATSLALDFSYELGPDEDAAVRALYGSRAVELVTPAAVPALTLEAPVEDGMPLARQSHRYFSYDARWSKRLDASSALTLRLDYHGTTVAPREVELPSAIASETALDAVLVSRSIGAAGTWEDEAGPDHRLAVEFRARSLDVPAEDLRALGADAAHAFQGPAGLAIGFEAQDTWTPGGPVSMTFGLGYRQSVGNDPGLVVIPRVGGAWSTDALSVRALLSYHRPAGDEGPPAADDPFAPEAALGWDASVEVPLGQGLHLAGAVRHAPIRIAGLGWDRRSASPAFLTGGDASVGEQTLALVQDAGDTRTVLEVTRGEVEGTLAAILSWDLPLQRLVAGSVSYDGARLSVTVVPSGTDVTIEYCKLAQVEAGAAGGGAGRDSIELRVLQDVLTARALGRWRFLMALRAASLDAGSGVAGIDHGDAELLSALDHRLSAGLSVVF